MKELQNLLGTPRIQLNTLEQNYKLIKDGVQILDEIVLKRKTSSRLDRRKPMFQAETLDHVAFPVRDLPRSEKFYLETVGLAFLTQRKNADGSPRHTYVKAGENIVGLTLPGVAVPASASGAPRYAIACPTKRLRCGGEKNPSQRREMLRQSKLTAPIRPLSKPFSLSIPTIIRSNSASAASRSPPRMASAM